MQVITYPTYLSLVGKNCKMVCSSSGSKST